LATRAAKGAATECTGGRIHAAPNVTDRYRATARPRYMTDVGDE
jgi:hypothetical protein